MEKYFEELYKEHYRLVVKTAYSVLRDVSASQDIASEVFLKLLENLMIKKDIKNVKAWLCIVAKYTAYDYLKAKKLEVPYEKLEYSIQNENFTSQVHTKLFTVSVINELYFKNPKWCEILLLHYLLEMSIKEIAVLCECSESSANNYIYKAKKYLQKKYDSSDFTDIVALSFALPGFAIIITYFVSCSFYS